MRALVVWLFVCCIIPTNAQPSDSQLQLLLDSLSQEMPELNKPVDFTLVNAPLSELIRAVAQMYDLNVSIGDVSSNTVTNNFSNISVKDVFRFIELEYSLQINFVNNIFTFQPKDKTPEIRSIVTFDSTKNTLTLQIAHQTMSAVASSITAKTPINLIVNQHVGRKLVHGYIRGLPLEEAIVSFIEINGLSITQKGERLFLISELTPINSAGAAKRSNYIGSGRQKSRIETFYKGEKPYVSVQCFQMSAATLIRQVSDELGIDYVLTAEPESNISCHLDSVSYEAFLGIVLERSKMIYTSDKGIFLIGKEDTHLLDRAKVYRFQHRTVEGVVDVIPAALTKQLEIKTFNDLNALIITGHSQAISRLLEFFKSIDEPVANVLIEVMVIEIRKGSSVSTGVEAFLSDTVPNTSGQVFSGVDFTLSFTSINKILNNLDNRGIVNLGKVSPKFYATIKAMEEMNNLNIRSTPKLSTLNGHEATMTIGQSVYYLIETQNVTGGVNPIVTVTPRYEKVEANLDLKINPFVSDLEHVTLSITAEFSDFIAPEVTGAPPGNATRKFISRVRMKNEEMVVIGGLEEVSKSEGGRGVPILSKIPILKWIFSSKNESKSNNKLLIFIKPTVTY